MEYGYQYVTLRLVPSIEREEFMNVGVVVYSQMANFLDAATLIDPERVRAFAPHLSLTDLDAALEAMCSAVRGEAVIGRPQMPNLGQRFGWLTAPRSTILQPGPMHGGVTNDPRDTLNSLLRRLVGPA